MSQVTFGKKHLLRLFEEMGSHLRPLGVDLLPLAHLWVKHGLPRKDVAAVMMRLGSQPAGTAVERKIEEQADRFVSETRRILEGIDSYCSAMSNVAAAVETLRESAENGYSLSRVLTRLSLIVDDKLTVKEVNEARGLIVAKDEPLGKVNRPANGCCECPYQDRRAENFWCRHASAECDPLVTPWVIAGREFPGSPDVVPGWCPLIAKEKADGRD